MLYNVIVIDDVMLFVVDAWLPEGMFEIVLDTDVIHMGGKVQHIYTYTIYMYINTCDLIL